MLATRLCCKPTYRYPVNELPPLYTPAGQPGIAHARNVNVGTGIGERESKASLGTLRRDLRILPPLRKDEGLADCGGFTTPADCER